MDHEECFGHCVSYFGFIRIKDSKHEDQEVAGLAPPPFSQLVPAAVQQPVHKAVDLRPHASWWLLNDNPYGIGT